MTRATDILDSLVFDGAAIPRDADLTAADFIIDVGKKPSNCSPNFMRLRRKPTPHVPLSIDPDETEREAVSELRKRTTRLAETKISEESGLVRKKNET